MLCYAGVIWQLYLALEGDPRRTKNFKFKKAMNKIIHFLILFSLFGCTRKCHKSLEIAINNFNQENLQMRIFYKQGDIDITKIITSKQINPMCDSFVAIFHWVNHLPVYNTKDFRLLFYNLKRNEKTFIYNSRKITEKVIIEKDVTNNKNFFFTDSIILESILKNGISHFLRIKKECYFDEISNNYHLIFFNNNKYEFFRLDNFCPEQMNSN
jgi:hypothetical protein